MEKYFETLSDTGALVIPKQFTEKFGWNEKTLLYQFTRGGEIYITNRKQEHTGQNLCESYLDGANMLDIHRPLLDKAGFGLDERLAVYMFYDEILGIAKDFRECVICGKESELATVNDKHICYDCTLQISGIEDNAFK